MANSEKVVLIDRGIIGTINRALEKTNGVTERRFYRVETTRKIADFAIGDIYTVPANLLVFATREQAEKKAK